MSSEDNPLIFNLSKDERRKLKNKNHIIKHYHNVHFPDDTVAVVMGENIRKEQYEYLLKRGIDVCPIDITGKVSEFLGKLTESVAIQQSKSSEGFPLYVMCIRQEDFEEIRRGVK